MTSRNEDKIRTTPTIDAQRNDDEGPSASKKRSNQSKSSRIWNRIFFIDKVHDYPDHPEQIVIRLPIEHLHDLQLYFFQRHVKMYKYVSHEKNWKYITNYYTGNEDNKKAMY